MSYFVQREEVQPRRGRVHVVPASHEERIVGKGRPGEYHPVAVERGANRDEIIAEELKAYQQRNAGDNNNYFAKFTPSYEHTAEDMQARHPEIRKQLESHLFDAPRPDPVPPIRLRPVDEVLLRQLQPHADTRKEDAARAISEGPTMIDRMLQAHHPVQRPPHNELYGHRCQPEFAVKRNHSQIAVGGFQTLPVEPSTERHARRTVAVDYATYIPDKIQPKRFYAIDGKMVDAATGQPLVKNFFSGEPLLCAKYMTEEAPYAPISARSREQSMHHEAQIPEPPQRKMPFDHGPRALR